MEEHKLVTGMLLVALVVSMAGTLFTLDYMNELSIASNGGLTAAATGTGTSNVSVTQDITITLPDSTITFGSGKATGAVATLNSFLGTATNWNDTVASDNFTIQNDGNVKINLTVKSTRANGTAGNGTTGVMPENASFACVNVDGTNDVGTCGSGAVNVKFSFRAGKGETGSCTTSTLNENYGSSTYIGFGNTSVEYQACGCMGSANSADLLNVGLVADLPSDAVGNKGATLTFTSYANDGCV